MLLAEPPHTQYDLRFSVAGFPVRIHPLFFLVPLVMGAASVPGNTIGETMTHCLVLTLIFLISILIHELGHSFAMKYYGESSHIVLYWMGGLAIPDVGRWNAARARPRTQWSQIVISAAGPIAGALPGFLLIGVLLAMGGTIYWDYDTLIPLPVPDLSKTNFANNDAMRIAFYFGMFSSFFWNILNLVPVWPLDGGQISMALFTIFDPWAGARKALILSIVVAVVLAVSNVFGGFGRILFIMMAFESYMLLMQSGGGFGGRRW